MFFLNYGNIIVVNNAELVFGASTPSSFACKWTRVIRMLVVLLLSEQLDTSRHQEPLEQRIWLSLDCISVRFGEMSDAVHERDHGSCFRYLIASPLPPLFAVGCSSWTVNIGLANRLRFTWCMNPPWSLGYNKAWQDRFCDWLLALASWWITGLSISLMKWHQEMWFSILHSESSCEFSFSGSHVYNHVCLEIATWLILPVAYACLKD